MKKVCISYETGGGRFGGHYTHYSFTGLPGVEIAALADSNPEAEHSFRLTGAKRLYSSFLAMMEQEKPDIVVLCSRLPKEHYEQIKYALNRGCHVLCEKPLAETPVQADELIALSKKTRRLVQMEHPARFAPTFRKMRQMIEAGEIGKILTCYMRGKEDPRGGGEDMLVLGTHVLDAASWLFGMPEKVFSEIRWQGKPLTPHDTLKTAEPCGPCGGDEIFSYYRFRNGVNGIFESRRLLKGGPSGQGGPERLGITVCGSTGILTIRYSDRNLRICRDFPVPMEDRSEFQIVPLEEEPEIPGSIPLDYEKLGLQRNSCHHRYYVENNRRAAWNLLQSIEGKETLTAGIDSALISLEMIVGAYQSALTQKPVAFPLQDRRHPLA